MCELWFHGAPADRIAIFRMISIELGDIRMEEKSSRNYYSKSKQVINEVIRQQLLTEVQIDTLQVAERQVVFETAFLKLAKPLYPEKSEEKLHVNVGKMHYATIYDRIRKLSKA